jgi:hypothetical protein
VLFNKESTNGSRNNNKKSNSTSTVDGVTTPLFVFAWFSLLEKKKDASSSSRQLHRVIGVWRFVRSFVSPSAVSKCQQRANGSAVDAEQSAPRHVDDEHAHTPLA